MEIGKIKITQGAYQVVQTKYIHIYWEGPFTLSQLSCLQDTNKDYGVYQIYGGHPVYGSMVLLYIGKADQQTFGVRIAQESWHLNRNYELLKVYVGRLAGERKPTLDEWSKQIVEAEKLLIYSHAPAVNSQYISSLNEDGLQKIHILNWGSHCDLMAEISGMRWTSHFANKLQTEYRD